MYRVDLLSDILLYKLYEKHVSSDNELELSIRDIADLFNRRIPLNLVRSAIQLNRQAYSESDKLIKRKGIKGNYSYDISLAGIAKVQNELRRSSSPIAFYSGDPERNLQSVAGIHSDFMTSDERLRSEAWVPLPVDRESVAFIDMQASVVEAIDAIEVDNGFAANFPAERAGILQTLSDGLDWIMNKMPTKAQIQSSLLAPLTWIIVKFGDGLIVEAAKKAANKIVEWLQTML
jgi:hypothetical protein